MRLDIKITNSSLERYLVRFGNAALYTNAVRASVSSKFFMSLYVDHGSMAKIDIVTMIVTRRVPMMRLEVSFLFLK